MDEVMMKLPLRLMPRRCKSAVLEINAVFAPRTRRMAASRGSRSSVIER